MSCFTCLFLSLSFPRLLSCSPVFHLIITACLFKPVFFSPWLFASTSVFSCVPRFFPVFCQPFLFFCLFLPCIFFCWFWIIGPSVFHLCSFQLSCCSVTCLPQSVWMLAPIFATHKTSHAFTDILPNFLTFLPNELFRKYLLIAAFLTKVPSLWHSSMSGCQHHEEGLIWSGPLRRSSLCDYVQGKYSSRKEAILSIERQSCFRLSYQK